MPSQDPESRVELSFDVALWFKVRKAEAKSEMLKHVKREGE